MYFFSAFTCCQGDNIQLGPFFHAVIVLLFYTWDTKKYLNIISKVLNLKECFWATRHVVWPLVFKTYNLSPKELIMGALKEHGSLKIEEYALKIWYLKFLAVLFFLSKGLKNSWVSKACVAVFSKEKWRKKTFFSLLKRIHFSLMKCFISSHLEQWTTESQQQPTLFSQGHHFKKIIITWLFMIQCGLSRPVVQF